MSKAVDYVDGLNVRPVHSDRTGFFVFRQSLCSLPRRPTRGPDCDVDVGMWSAPAYSSFMAAGSESVDKLRIGFQASSSEATALYTQGMVRMVFCCTLKVASASSTSSLLAYFIHTRSAQMDGRCPMLKSKSPQVIHIAGK